MKKLIAILLVLASVAVLAAPPSIITKKKTFATSGQDTVTTSSFAVPNASKMDFTTGTYGTDSLKLFIFYEKNVAGNWINVARDTINYGGSTSGNKYKVKTILIDSIAGARYMRVKTVKFPFRSQDSTSQTYYSLYMFTR